MATSYSAIPQGGLYDVPSSLPQGLLYRYKKISNISRQTLRWVPNNGQGDVWAGQVINVTLPTNAMIDLSTLTMDFDGYTQHNGSNGVLGPAGYCQTRFFPRNTQSLIDSLSVKINGQTRQLINNYGLIYNILSDITSGADAIVKNRVGQNADPSNKYYSDLGGTRRRCGYPIGRIADKYSANDFDRYTIRNWLGFFQGSTSIIDSQMFGDIQLEITLAGAGVLMLGASPEAAVLAAVTAANSDCGAAVVGGAQVVAAIAAEGSSYKLSNISFSVVRYDLPQTVFDAMSSVLASGAIYQYWYPNYYSLTGSPVTGDKTGSMRASLTSSSLDMLIGTFLVQNRDTPAQPIIGNGATKKVSAQAKGEFGDGSLTFNNIVNYHAPQSCFNQSKYFVRNGTTLKQCRWGIGNVFFNYETIPEQFNSMLTAFNSHNHVLGGCHPGLTGIPAFKDTYYAHVHALNATGENDIFTVSGLDASETPVQITWEYTGGDVVTNAVFPEIYQAAVNTIHTPMIIAVHSAHLDIMANRNIITKA